MGRKISDYIISVVLALLISVPFYGQQSYDYSSTRPQRPATDKGKQKKEKKEPEVTYPLFNGISVGLDLWSLGNGLLGGNGTGSAVIVDVNLKHRYFPVIELGYAASDKWSDNGIHCQTQAPYFRLGMDYNVFYGKKHGHMLFVGVRYAVSSFNYDVNSPSISDPIYSEGLDNPHLPDDIWGGSVPYHHNDMKSTQHWGELNLGLRTRVWGNLYMGWSVRYRIRLKDTHSPYGSPWYVPGFGRYDSSNLGVIYAITYKLPYKKK